MTVVVVGGLLLVGCSSTKSGKPTGPTGSGGQSGSSSPVSTSGSASTGKLTKTFVLKNFVAAIAFINSLVPECERLDHHPEIFTVYNKVNLTLTTYDAGQRISSHDVLLAGRIEGLMAKAPGSP